MKRTAALVGALSLLGGATSAQAPQPEDVEAVTVEELVVRARLPGPAWWRVSDADSTVYVLGLPEALPKGMSWNQTVLERRLKGAHGLITPPVYQASANPLAAPGLLLGLRRATKSKTPMSDSLPAELRPRFARAAARAGKSAESYQSLRPWFAGLQLADHYRSHVGLVVEPLDATRRAAKRAKVPIRPAYVVHEKASALLAQVKTAPEEAGTTCVAAAIEEVEAGDAAIRAAAAAWAAGDPRVALGAPRSHGVCFAGLPGVARLKRDEHARQADAIAAALAEPGHTVAALSLRSLVAKDGILQRLQIRGYTVRVPE